MEEELKHIDLIDKYLSNTLNSVEEQEVTRLLKEDESFAKEVEVYRQMYKGMEAQSNASLKQRLDIYYKEYEKEQQDKPKGIYKTLYIGISLAACLLLGLFLYTEFVGPKDFSKDPNDPMVGTDSTEVIKKDSLKETPIELVKEEDKKSPIAKDTLPFPEQFNKDAQLALGGLKRLPPPSVRSLSLNVLLYTFKEGELTLYGNPLISGLQIEVLRKDLRYLLRYQNNHYDLREVEQQARLIPLDANVDPNEWKEVPSEEEVKVKIAGISEIKSTPAPLEVFYKEEKSAPIYRFEGFSEKTRLIVSGNLDFENVVVYQITRDEVTTYFVQSGKKIFILNLGASEITPLEEASIMQNRDARLFIEKETLIKKVYTLQ